MRERVGEYLPPLSRYQANYDIAVMLSWYSIGYGWLGSSGSWYERRGSWGGQSEERSDVEWFCWKCGTKVLRWNVAGGVFLSLISSVGDLNPGMTDFVHVGELILRPQLTDDLNDFMSASAAHVKVTNTWANTHTELTLPTVSVVWFTTALCEDFDRKIVQMLWMLKQMECGRAGLVQDDIRARMKEDESLVALRAPMTSTVASMMASMGASLVAPMASLVASMAFVGLDGGGDGLVVADDSGVQM